MVSRVKTVPQNYIEKRGGIFISGLGEEQLTPNCKK